MIRKINLSSCEKYLLSSNLCDLWAPKLPSSSLQLQCVWYSYESEREIFIKWGHFQLLPEFQPILDAKSEDIEKETERERKLNMCKNFFLFFLFFFFFHSVPSVNALRTLKRVHSIYAHSLKTYSGIEKLLNKIKGREINVATPTQTHLALMVLVKLTLTAHSPIWASYVLHLEEYGCQCVWKYFIFALHVRATTVKCSVRAYKEKKLREKLLMRNNF